MGVSGDHLRRVLLITLLPVAVSAGTNYVSLSGGHHPPFANWSDAATNIQAALDAAGQSNTVLVAPGTYTGFGNLDLDFAGKSLTLRSVGGAGSTIIDCAGVGRGFNFHSGESTSAQVIGFTVRGATIPGAMLIVSNSNPVIGECRIRDNVTSPELVPITNGCCGDGDPPCGNESLYLPLLDFGAGVIIKDASPSFNSCEISGNRAAGGGGGVWITSNARPRFDNCTFAGNNAYASSCTVYRVCVYDGYGNLIYRSQAAASSGDGFGGGIAVEGSAPLFEQCTFLENGADGAGGGAWITSNAHPQFNSCFFMGNGACFPTSSVSTWVVVYDGFGSAIFSQELYSATGQASGGGIAAVGSTVDIQQCTFLGNQAVDDGGGIFIEAGSAHLNATDIEGNTAGMRGGGLCGVSNATLSVDASTISGNSCSAGSGLTIMTVTIYDGEGHVVYFHQTRISTAPLLGLGGGLYLDAGEALIRDSTLSHNEVAAEGGGIFITASTARLESCSITANKALSLTQEVIQVIFPNTPSMQSSTNTWWQGTGGGLVCASSRLDLVSCIVASNWAGGLLFRSGSIVTADNSIIVANLAGVTTWSTTTVSALTGWYRTESGLAATGMGAACYLDDSALTLRHCTVGRNNQPEHQDTVCAVSNAVLTAVNTVFDDDSLLIATDATMTASYSRLPSEWPGVGNITNDALLAQAWRLTATSPCIDAAVELPGLPADIEGEARWDHPAHSNTFSISDMGADEFVDEDLDTLGDSWELQFFGTLTALGATGDYDADEATDGQEYELGLNPTAASSDGDAMSDGWELERDTDPFADDGNADPDDDAYVNNGEYVADTDPWDGSDYPRVLQITGGVSGDGVTVWWPSSSRRSYRVLASTNFQDWAEVAALPGTGVLLEYDDPATSASNRCYRLSVEIPP